MSTNNFAIVGCRKCKRMMVAELSHATKTCQCGHKIDLNKVPHIIETDSAKEAGDILRQLTSKKDSGFTSAEKLASFSLADKLLDQ